MTELANTSAPRLVPSFGVDQAARKAAHLSVTVATDAAAFMALRQEWNDLPQAALSPLARHEWFQSCFEAFGDTGELRIFVARAGRSLRAVAPLVLDRSETIPRLRFLGHQLLEPQMLLHADEAAL